MSYWKSRSLTNPAVSAFVPLLALVCSLMLFPSNYAKSDAAALIQAQDLKYPSSSPRQAPCVVWTDPQVPPKVALLCIHGLGLHKGTFTDFGRQMCKSGIATYAMDMRGFGEYVEKKKHPKLDFDGCLVDIKYALEQIRKNNPGIPVVILGESMGGAIALRATALYPELISGLISSVPAGDRFSLGDAAAKVGLSAIFGGMNKPVERVGETVVEHATKNPELKRRWMSDPLVRLNFTPNELLQFNSFMNENFEVARAIKETPVLFIQGANDRLVRPAGTWKLYDRLATPSRQLVLSKTSEHLIFEEGQFSAEDLNFVRTWINRNILAQKAKVSPPVVPSPGSPTAVPGVGSSSAVPGVGATSPPTVSSVSNPNGSRHSSDVESPAMINYWIELYREEKLYRCNNKMQFRSGDVIRFHLIPDTDGFAYLVMTAGTSGKSQLLFPNPEGGRDNFLHKGKDYSIPSSSWLQFDKTPGTERMKLLFSKSPINVVPETIGEHYVTCYVSPDSSGAKDLVPTRMKLTWDDPKPVLIPDDFAGISQITHAGVSGGASSLVRLASGGTGFNGAIVSADIALTHE